MLAVLQGTLKELQGTLRGFLHENNALWDALRDEKAQLEAVGSRDEKGHLEAVGSRTGGDWRHVTFSVSLRPQMEFSTFRADVRDGLTRHGLKLTGRFDRIDGDPTCYDADFYIHFTKLDDVISIFETAAKESKEALEDGASTKIRTALRSARQHASISGELEMWPDTYTPTQHSPARSGLSREPAGEPIEFDPVEDAKGPKTSVVVDPASPGEKRLRDGRSSSSTSSSSAMRTENNSRKGRQMVRPPDGSFDRAHVLFQRKYYGAFGQDPGAWSGGAWARQAGGP